MPVGAMSVRRFGAATVLVLAMAMHAGVARAQSGDDDDRMETVIARALVDRAADLMSRRDYENARQLYIEALERDPKGPHAATALAGLRQANQRLGRYKDDGVPKPDAGGGGGGDVIDPYGDGGSGSGGGGDGGGGGDVIDPYGDGGGGGGTGGGGGDVIDPYGDGGGGAGGGGAGDGGDGSGPIDVPEDGTTRQMRRELMTWAGVLGFVGGMGIADPDEDGAALLGLLGGAGGIGAAYWASNRWDLSKGDIMAVESAGTWGAIEAAFLFHAMSGSDYDYESVDGFRSAAVGGAVGTAGGVLWARRADPKPGDIAFVNSLGLYGGAAGLLFGLTLDPPEPEAYSVNAMIASSAGLVAGFLLADRVETSRRRMLKVDVGAAIGAGAPWALLYPLIEDENSNDDEQLVSLVSILTMGGGAYLAWRFTSDDTDEEGEPEPEAAAVPAVARRDSNGQWSFGMPLPRPMEDPRLAPLTGAFNVGVDLLGGRF
jgi:hypothetical protein